MAYVELREKTREVQDAIRDINTRLIDVEHFLARLALPTVPSPPRLPEYFPPSSRWLLEIFPDEVSAWREALARIPREPLREKERSFLRSMDYYIVSERRVTLPQLAWLSAIIRRVGDALPEIPIVPTGGSSSSNPRVQGLNKALDEMEVLIMRAIYPPDCYSISLTFRKENLPLIRRALEPLGYTLRFPRRSSVPRGLRVRIPEGFEELSPQVCRVCGMKIPEHFKHCAVCGTRVR